MLSVLSSSGMHYPKQYSISKSDCPVSHSWRQTRCRGWTINTAPSLPVNRIIRGGEDVGAVLGWFTLHGRFYGTNGVLELTASGGTMAVYPAMCGRFVLLSVETGELQIRTDAAALLPVVFDELEGNVASTPLVIASYRPVELRGEVTGGVNRTDGKVWYPFGLTPYDGVRRILPGHSLWPSTGRIEREDLPQVLPGASPRETVAKVVESVVESVSAFGCAGFFNAHLTAGYDSRLVVAACLAAGQKPDCITIADKNNAGLDLEIAKRLARRVGLSHRTLIFSPASSEEIELWKERTSHCIEDSVTQLCRTVRMNDDRRYTLTGMCGEVARGFYWELADLDQDGLDPEALVKRLGFKCSPLLLGLAESWLGALASQNTDGFSLPRTRILDYAYIEHRLGGWAAPSVFGHEIDKPTMSPFNRASTFALMLSLSELYRIQQRFANEFIEQTAEALLELPFNHPVGLLWLKYWRQWVKQLLPNRAKNIMRRVAFR